MFPSKRPLPLYRIPLHTIHKMDIYIDIGIDLLVWITGGQGCRFLEASSRTGGGTVFVEFSGQEIPYPSPVIYIYMIRDFEAGVCVFVSSCILSPL